MSTNVFSALPYDVKLHEIAPYLTSADVLSLNEVLKKDERVYKKLPADYALKHALKTKRIHYETIATRLNLLLSNVGDWDDVRVRRAVMELKKVFAFLKDPVNSIIFMYLRGLKEKMIRMVEQWMVDDQELYTFMRDGGRELLNLATETRDYITSVPFVRHVSTVDHQSVF
jgi:hypothetical protein